MILHGLVADSLYQHQDALLHLLPLLTPLPYLLFHLLQNIPEHFVELALRFAVFLRQLRKLGVHFFIFFQKLSMDVLYPFFSLSAVAFQLFSDVIQVSVERVFDFPDDDATFLVLSFDQIANNSTFFIDEFCNSCVTCFSLVDMLRDHLQGHFLASLALFLDSAVGLSVIERDLFANFRELNRSKSTICLSSQCLSLKDPTIFSNSVYRSMTCFSRQSIFLQASALWPILRQLIFSASMRTLFSVICLAKFEVRYGSRCFLLEIGTYFRMIINEGS